MLCPKEFWRIWSKEIIQNKQKVYVMIIYMLNILYYK